MSGPATGLVQHVYDHAGDRVETRIDGVATKYLVDANRGLSQILEERSAGGSLIASYVHGDDGMVLERFEGATSTPAYYLHDAQQSVRQLASSGGAITDAYSYSAFGVTRTASGATVNAYRYGGQWNDPRTGFYHLRARWMDPTAARFSSTDPFGGTRSDPLSMHPFMYAHGSPISRSDPTGMYTLGEFSTALGVSSVLGGLGGLTYGSIREGLGAGLAYAFVGATAAPVFAAAAFWGGALVAAGAGVSEGIGIFAVGSAMNVAGMGFSAYEYAYAETPREKAAALFSLALGGILQAKATTTFIGVRAGSGTFTDLGSTPNPREAEAGRAAANFFKADIVRVDPTPGAQRGPGTSDYRIVLRRGPFSTLEVKHLNTSVKGMVSEILHAQGDNVLVVVPPGRYNGADLSGISGRVFSPNAPGSPKNQITIMEDTGSSYRLLYHKARQ